MRTASLIAAVLCVVAEPLAAKVEVQFSVSCGQADQGDMATDGRFLVVSQPKAQAVLLFDVAGDAARLLTVVEGLGTVAGQFKGPGGVAVDAQSGLLYVSDTYNHRLQVFHLVARDGGGVEVRFAKAIGRHGTLPGEFDRPGALARAADGSIFAIDSGNRRVQVFAPNLSFVRVWGEAGTGDGQFLRPLDIAVGAAAGLVYVLDADQRRVQAFGYDGTFRFTWGGPRPAEPPAVADGRFLSPFGISVGRHGEVYVTDCGAHVVQQLDPHGQALRRWGRFGTANGEFNQPRQIAVDERGRVIVLDFANRRGQLFSDLGRFLQMFRVTRAGLGAKASVSSPTPR